MSAPYSPALLTKEIKLRLGVCRNLQAFQAYMQPLIRTIRHPASLFNQASTSGSATPSSMLTRIRDVNTQQLASAGVVAAEVLGFFTVGEMIGRMKIVGYRGGEEHH